MKNEGYYIVYQSENGIGIQGPFNKEEALERVEEKFYGDLQALDKLPDMFGDQLESYGLVIIKGGIVVPTPKQVVTVYEME